LLRPASSCPRPSTHHLRRRNAAVRQRQADIRLPGLAERAPGLSPTPPWMRCKLIPRCPSWPFAFPKCGRVSRKEREEKPSPLRSEKGRQVHTDDFKRLVQGFPGGRSPKSAELTARAEPTSSSSWLATLPIPSRPATPSLKPAERARDQHLTRPPATSAASWPKNTPSVTEPSPVTEKMVQEADPHPGKCVDGTVAYPSIWIVDLSLFEYDLARPQSGSRAHPSLHRAPRGRHGQFAHRSGLCRANCYDLALRWLWAWFRAPCRIHSQGRASRSSSHWDFGRGSRAASASSSTRWKYGNSAPRRRRLGLDRIVMLLAGSSSLREVIAFPQDAEKHLISWPTRRLRSPSSS